MDDSRNMSNSGDDLMMQPGKDRHDEETSGHASTEFDRMAAVEVEYDERACFSVDGERYLA